ncbi:hypothetical protein PCH_Pc12g15030 [Penicillium rubens Wisconsin 54-1255]|uniref:Uncharacterized protein n=1 Tax=Penicillium rubens (strain ATCC 28089 / DSM 1075 / NRRL 1951 / Wisconsin 54-1255) TaxID=500485 RepID=B6GX72_PENRW|nr:hypothetical protein PCH_Pc12g15030 [Penicillium rubens Wisconsin 54-1255]
MKQSRGRKVDKCKEVKLSGEKGDSGFHGCGADVASMHAWMYMVHMKRLRSQHRSHLLSVNWASLPLENQEKYNRTSEVTQAMLQFCGLQFNKLAVPGQIIWPEASPSKVSMPGALLMFVMFALRRI